MIFALGDEAESASTRQRKKKSRWGGSESDKTFIPGMPTVLPPSLDSHQQEAYLGKDNTHFFRFLVDLIEFFTLIFTNFIWNKFIDSYNNNNDDDNNIFNIFASIILQI